MNSTAAIYARLTTASAITSALDIWNGLPAIFDDRAPDEYLAKQDKACIVIAFPTGDEPSETFTEASRVISRDLRVYALDTGDNAPVDNLAEAVRDLFHDRPADLIVAGAKTVICQASGPTASPTTDPSLVGRRISLRLELERI